MLSALAGLATGLFSSGLNFASSAISARNARKMQQKQFEHNMALQHDSQQWQERMSNTSHRREVNDLRQAGLNPILTVSGGSGAPFSNASGSSVSAPTADIDLGGNALGSILGSAAQVASADAAQKNADTNAQGVQSQILKNTQDIATSNALEAKHKAEALKSLAETQDIKSGMPNNRFFGNALKSVSKFLEGDLFQNSASKLFLNEAEFNKRIDRWYNQRKSEWQSRRNSLQVPLKVPGQKDEIQFSNGFKR